jgi:integrating conjugative element protein (TIGR03752 family)
MALSLKGNKIPYILLGALVLFAIVTIFRSGKEAPAPQAMKAVPTPAADISAPVADGDTPQDTLRTLTSELKQVHISLAQVSKENDELRDRNERLLRDRNQTVEEVARKVGEQIATDSGPMGGVLTRLNQMETRLANVDVAGGGARAGANGIPGGFGYEGGGALAPAGGANAWAHPAATTWVEPMGRTVAPAPGSGNNAAATQVAYTDPLDALPPTGAGISSGPYTGSATAPGAAQRTSAAAPVAEAEPWFTVPENATLIGSTTMTALIGRVPVNGKVTDPVPFKALIGRPNLAANGLDVPDEVVGMVVSGKAIGDWTLSCVYGNVESVTFLFADGTIRTVSNRRGNSAGSSPGVSEDRIAWLSDDRGVPCIGGSKITNAPAWITTQVGIQTLGIAAEAAAAAQTTTTSSALTGGATSSVTGDQGKYILGKSASGAANELSNWITARMANSFDAIFVQAGVRVALHMDRAIELDKLPDARKLDYRRARAAQSRVTARLD